MRDMGVHEEVIRKIVDFSVETGFVPIGLDYSPIKGPEGNIEYLLYIKKTQNEMLRVDETLIKKMVDNAHLELSAHVNEQ